MAVAIQVVAVNKEPVCSHTGNVRANVDIEADILSTGKCCQICRVQWESFSHTIAVGFNVNPLLGIVTDDVVDDVPVKCRSGCEIDKDTGSSVARDCVV